MSVSQIMIAFTFGVPAAILLVAAVLGTARRIMDQRKSER